MNSYSDITIQPLASSTQEKHYLLSCGDRYYEASYPIVELIIELQQKATKEEAISAYVETKKGKYTTGQVADIMDKFITPILVAKESKSHTFLYEKELLSASNIDKYSNKFHFLFNKVYLWLVFAIMISMDMYFFFHAESLLAFNNAVNAYTVMGLFLFMLFSSFVHELGHASACKYFGIKHGGIGFGLYLNFPVLYTDVTEVWKLKRKQRLVVNIAGVYFQSICLIALLIGFLLTRNDILRYLILIINLGFLMTLNPFFKFDGYWIMSDLLGVPNLHNRSKELLSYIYKRMCRQQMKQKPYLLQIRTIEKYSLLFYSTIVNIFMGIYFLYIIPRFLYHFIISFPNEIQELTLYLSNRLPPSFVLLRNVSMQLIFLTFIGFFFLKLVQSLRKHAKH